MNLNASIIDQRLSGIQDEIRFWAENELNLTDAYRLKPLAFVYLCVKTMLDLDAQEAFDCVTDGSGDFGVDAMQAEPEIVEIGRFVMHRALHDAAMWAKNCPSHRASRVALNISGKQLQSDHVADVLKSILNETGVEPERVVIEVTESVLLPNDGVAAAQLREIAELGVSVFIDDFGTGWASLHYLRSLPVSGLKLAQEFVAGLPNDFDFGLAQAIRELSQSMNLSEVIAEGIESHDQLTALKDMGYRLGQGFLLHEPMAIDPLVAVLQATPNAAWELGQRTDRASDEAAERLKSAQVIVPAQLSFRNRHRN